MTPPDPPVASVPAEPSRRVRRAVIWLPGLAVAVGAAVATAHGLYETAVAGRVPVGIAWLYPLITDGLGLVAYAATARLHGPAIRYAWSVVVLAAGLSGLAQATYLASGSAVEASPALRFGVGAWPAIAAAIVAHLLYLLATDNPPPRSTELPTADVHGAFTAASVQPGPTGVQRGTGRTIQPGEHDAVQRPAEPVPADRRPALTPPSVERDRPRLGGSPARDRAGAAAARHATHHGALPTVTELEALAQVSRGTASAVLKALREHPAPLHLVSETPEPRTQP